MIDRMTLKTKIALLVLAALVGLLALTGLSAMKTRQDLLESKKETIQSVLEGVEATLTAYQKEEAAGKMTREQAQKAATEVISMIRYGGQDGKSEYVYAYTTEGYGVYHVAKDRIGKPLFDTVKDPKGNYTVRDIVAKAKATPSGAYLYTLTARPGEKEPIDKLGYVKLFEPWSWVVGTGVYVDDIDTEFRRRLVSDLAIAFGLLAIIAWLGFVIARGVIRQVGGEPADAIRFMARVSDGDLSGDMPDVMPGSMLDSMGNMVRSLRKMVSEIGENSLRLSKGSDHISTASREVATAAQKQSDATSAMAAAIEELTVSINHISENARDSQQNSAHSVQLSEAGFERVQTASEEINGIASVVSDAATRVRKLEERANQISSIAGVIKEIAGQTNLLALNAAIEAARAGEQGRGFAVVADEVRKLAERTSLATVEIEEMIAGIQSDTVQVAGVMDAALPQVDSGVAAAQSAADSLRQIKESSERTLERIREVADSTQEQSVASDNIAQKVEEIASMVEETTAAMSANAETAGDMERIADELNLLVGRFRC
ncbi:methyl-accepting chemotaxis protein [uncultured Propionivibrio sp.]|uniref:methyl-accepting chemotaxis protein n=1 Tax=uncultured Propionivibrio sp. TaxID=426737 RepID=UPI0029C0379A|nr:methyl-accepting chemotaxis protein [uncultured Propionivibrio sp.]